MDKKQEATTGLFRRGFHPYGSWEQMTADYPGGRYDQIIEAQRANAMYQEQVRECQKLNRIIERLREEKTLAEARADYWFEAYRKRWSGQIRGRHA